MFGYISAHLIEFIVGVAIIAILTIILVAFLTSRSVTKAIKKKVPPKPPSKTPVEPDPVPEDKMPPLGGSLSRALALRGIFRVGDIGLSFLRALNFLRDHLDTVQYKYRLPWYLLIGASQSGKSSLLEGAEMVTPVGHPDFGIKDPRPGCRWWFFNRAVVLDIKGEFVIPDRGTRADEKGWRTVLALLTRYRARRPVDGIILTLSAAELYGAEQLSLDEVNDRAKYLANKLIATQNHLGLRLPVYVIITKSDVIPGFQSLCQEIPLQNRHNMLGWSNPHPLDIAYTPSWVDEALAATQRTLSKLRLEVFTQGVSSDTREGIFLLPTEILDIKERLSIYLDHVFKTSAYEESLLLRGLYFCGDSGLSEFPNLDEELQETQEEKGLSIKAIESLPLTEPGSSGARKIFFVNELMNEKVFFESGLAQPIYNRLVSANRNLNLAKIGMVSFVGIGTFGMLNAYDNFTQNRDYLLPVLGKINTILSQIPKTENPNARSNILRFDQNTHQLLEMMNNLQRADLFSFFIPSSWFSPVQKNLENSLKVSYDQIILRTIYMDLLLKARELLLLRPTGQDHSTSIAQLLVPTTSPEYQLFKSYAERFIQLLTFVEKYNRLKETHDASLLDELVVYTFNIHLPESFMQHYMKFRKVLQDVPYPEIDLRPYQPMARETLQVLYKNFLNALFSTTDKNSLLGHLDSILSTFGEKSATEIPSPEVLRRFSAELRRIVPTIGVAGSNWMDAPYFDPGGGFSDLMGAISESPFFGPTVVENFAEETAVGFARFHDELTNLNRLLIERSLAPSSRPIYPSEGILGLDKSLSELFVEPFMAPSTGQSFVTKVPENTVIFWNTKLVDLAVDLVKRYEDFISKQLPSFPPAIRETVKLTALQNLQDNIVSYIARAQHFVPVPQDVPGSVAAEETLRSKVTDVGEISPKMVTLLTVLEHGNAGKLFIELRQLLGTLSTRLLNQVEQVVQGYAPYQIKDNNFDWWDGTTPVAFDAFSVKDTDDLKAHLEMQRQEMKHLAFDYAQIMVNFLSSPPMREFQGNEPLLNRWKRIIEQLGLYDKKRPENTVSALEDFLVKDANTITLKNCFEIIPLATAQTTSGDFFLEVRQNFKRKLLARCEVLKRQESIENYGKLVDAYNKTMKGKFPFVGSSAPKDVAEVEPDDLKNFFSMYEEFGGSPQKILDQVYQLGPTSKDAMAFLTSMEAVKKFFKTYLKDNASGDDPYFDYSIDFRVNKEGEKHGNLIIEWTIQTDDTKITNNDKKRQGRWVFGKPTIVTFRWPETSDIQPSPDKAQPFMSVNEQTVTYTFPGRWSLLWLIRSQLAEQSDFPSSTDNNPYTLKFVIPNGPTEKTIVFDRVVVREPPKGKTLGKAIVAPEFPLRAPALTQEVLEVATKPVLVEHSLAKGEKVASSLKVAAEEGVPEATEIPEAPPPKDIEGAPPVEDSDADKEKAKEKGNP